MIHSFSSTSKLSLAIVCSLVFPGRNVWAGQPATSTAVAPVAAGDPAVSTAPQVAAPQVAAPQAAAPKQTPAPKSAPVKVPVNPQAPAQSEPVSVQTSTPPTQPALAQAASTPAVSPAATPVAAEASEKQPAAATVPAATMRVVHVVTEPLPPEAPLVAYFDVGVVVQTNWNKDPAYDFFSDDDTLPQGGLVIGADVLSTATAVLALDVNVLFADTSNVGPLPSYISNGDISETDLGGGATLRYSVLSWLAPQARVGGGVALQDARLTSVDFDELHQEFTTGYLTLGGGLAFTPPGARLSRTRTYLNSLGLRVIVEGGYRLAQELEFNVKAKPVNESDTPNAIAATRLGVLPQSGPYVRVSAHARF